MRWECRERFPRHRVFAIPTCVMHSFEVGGGENVPGACTTRHITYLVRGPFQKQMVGDAMILVHGTMATWIIRIQYCE